MEEKSGHATAAASQPHDSHGHFAPKPPPQSPSLPNANPVTTFLHEEMSVNSTNKDDTLVDVHVNNPLKKINKLLEDIKRQKAFSFDIKGSLGLAGIVLAISFFGIFGGTKAFCSKGEQSHIGTITVLNLVDSPSDSWITKAKSLWDMMIGKSTAQDTNIPRLVLIESNQTVYHLLGLNSKEKNIMSGVPYIVTGEVDSCSQTITVNQPNALQIQ